MKNKTALRQQFMAKRRALKSTERRANDMRVCEQFISCFEEHPVKTVHLFLSISRHFEIDTQPIIDFLRTRRVDIVVAKVDMITTSLQHYLLEETTQLEENLLGIPEPVNARHISVEVLDMILVPLLAFDRQGYRVGYGKGYYDKFLAECRPETLKIGLSAFPPVKTVFPAHHDIPLDLCITPEQVYVFRKK